MTPIERQILENQVAILAALICLPIDPDISTLLEETLTRTSALLSQPDAQEA